MRSTHSYRSNLLRSSQEGREPLLRDYGTLSSGVNNDQAVDEMEAQRRVVRDRSIFSSRRAADIFANFGTAFEIATYCDAATILNLLAACHLNKNQYALSHTGLFVALKKVVNRGEHDPALFMLEEQDGNDTDTGAASKIFQASSLPINIKIDLLREPILETLSELERNMRCHAVMSTKAMTMTVFLFLSTFMSFTLSEIFAAYTNLNWESRFLASFYTPIPLTCFIILFYARNVLHAQSMQANQNNIETLKTALESRDYHLAHEPLLELLKPVISTDSMTYTNGGVAKFSNALAKIMAKLFSFAEAQLLKYYGSELVAPGGAFCPTKLKLEWRQWRSEFNPNAFFEDEETQNVVARYFSR